MPKPKIDKVKLSQMLRAGRSQRECAKVFGVTEGAVSQAKKELNIDVVKSVSLENAHRVVDKTLNAVDQLARINERTNQIIEDLSKSSKRADKALILKACREVRNQLALQLDIFKGLYDLQAAAEFQEEVLTAIKEVDPDVRKRIVQRLNERRALRSAIKFD